MTKKFILCAFVSFALTTLFVSDSFAVEQDTRNTSEQYYTRIIDAAIALCDAKSEPDNASEKSSAAADMACRKGNFFKLHKPELITALARENVWHESYIVNYHLNNWFYTYQQQDPNFLVNR